MIAETLRAWPREVTFLCLGPLTNLARVLRRDPGAHVGQVGREAEFDLLRAVAERGYGAPTPIQARAIPAVLEGRDLLGHAASVFRALHDAYELDRG